MVISEYNQKILNRRRFLLILGAIIGTLGAIGTVSFWPYIRSYITTVDTTSSIIKPPKPNQFTDEKGKSIVGVVLGTGQQEDVADAVKKSVDIIGGVYC